MHNRRTLRWTLGVVAMAALGALAGCSKGSGPQGGSSAAAAGGNEVLFGTVGPISGGIAHIGKDVENGVRLALDEINAEHPVIGGKPVQFKLMAEDDAGDPKQATAVAQKMCDAKVVAVVGHLQSGTSIPASTVYNKCGIPMVTASATNPDLTKPGYRNVFRMIANDNQLGASVVDHAAKSGVKTAVIVDDRTALGQGLAAVFKETAAKDGIQVLDAQFTNDKATDFMAILTAIKAKNPDAIFYGGLDAQAGPMLRQMEQLGMSNVKYFGGDGICTVKLAELSAGAKTLGNVVCAEGGSSIQKMPGGREWKVRYDKQFPNQFQVYSPYTYDGAMLLADAMKRANSWDPKVYIPKLKESNYKGVTSNIQFEPNGELKNAAITLYVYKDGKKTPLN